MAGWAITYTVDLNHHGLYDENDEPIFYDWLCEQFGPIDYSISAGRWRWTTRISGRRTIDVKFRDKADAVFFKLTWL